MLKCSQCGHENEDSTLRCVCGNELQQAAATSLSPSSSTATTVSKAGRGLLWRKILFVVWALSFIPFFPYVHLRWNGPPIQRSALAAALFFASTLAAEWALGREKRRALVAWRFVFVSWATLFLPVLLIATEGIASEGWPQGKHNKVVAELLTLDFVLTLPAFLLSILAVIRSYRAVSAVALATGLAYLVNGVLLVRATEASKGFWFDLGSVLNIVLTGAKMGSYASIPAGLVFIAGAILIFRATRAVPAATLNSA